MSRLRINHKLEIPLSEIELSAIRAQGNGGQNVNKVASAIHLRFDIRSSSIEEHHKSRLLELSDARITKAGVIIIKSQCFRTQEQNKRAALERLADFVRSALTIQKARKATKPSKAVIKKRLDDKKRLSVTKSLRTKIL